MTRLAEPHLILVGLPGVGKTTVGEHLAAYLERPFLDFDLEIERLNGMSVANIFATHGEPMFRDAEVQVSQRLAMSDTPAVLSPGGGWIGNQPAVAHLRPVGRIIYLRVAPDEALRRLGTGIQTRPLFANGNPSEVMRRLFQARRLLYEQLADLVVETNGVDTDVVLHRVVAQLAIDSSGN